MYQIIFYSRITKNTFIGKITITTYTIDTRLLQRNVTFVCLKITYKRRSGIDANIEKNGGGKGT